jgi:hypothetical protein
MIKSGFDPKEAHRVWIKMNRAGLCRHGRQVAIGDETAGAICDEP